MALDLTTVKQDGMAYESAVEYTIAAGEFFNVPSKMKAFKIHPTTATQIVLLFQSSNLLMPLATTDDDGKIIPFRPLRLFCSADLTIEMLF